MSISYYYKDTKLDRTLRLVIIRVIRGPLEDFTARLPL